MLALLLALACAHAPADSPPATTPAATSPAAGSTPVVFGEADANGNPTTLIPGTPTDPASLYGACRERVEGAEKDGECTTAADCAPTGCSREVCAPKGADLTTTCDVQPCFAVLDQCGCTAGHCTWTLKGGA